MFLGPINIRYSVSRVTGFPLTKCSFLGSVAKLVEVLKVNFKGNASLGKKWMQLFLKRHPDIRFRVCQNLTDIRKGVS